MEDLSLESYMLPNSDRHLLRRGHINHWRLARVCIRDPQRNGKSVCCSSESNRQGAHEVQQEGREPCFIGYETRSVSQTPPYPIHMGTYYRHLFEERARGTGRARWQHRGKPGLGRGRFVVGRNDPRGE